MPQGCGGATIQGPAGQVAQAIHDTNQSMIGRKGDELFTAEAGDLAIASVPARLATACCC